jgi:hypothetical protein
MTVLEITPVEETDLDSTPPCDIYIRLKLAHCGKPAVCRIIRICGCGNRRTHFVCAECKDGIEEHGVTHFPFNQPCPEASVMEYI